MRDKVTVTLIILLTLMTTCAAESASLLDEAECASNLAFDSAFPCENLIDPTGLSMMTSTLSNRFNPDFTYTLNGSKSVQTVFIGNI